MNTIKERKNLLMLRVVDFAKQKRLEGKAEEEIIFLSKEYATNNEILTEINAIQNECEIIGHSIVNITASENAIIANNKTNLSYCINCGKALD